MRSSRAALALVLACTSNSSPPRETPPAEVRSPPPPTGRTVAVPGLTVAVPAGWVALTPDELAATRAQMASEMPADATLALDGAHAADGPAAGMVFLIRLDAPRDSSARTRTVRQALTRMREDMETRVVADGGEIVAADYREEASGLAGCATARVHHPTRSVEIRMCTRISHASPERLRMVQVMCMAEDHRIESVCAPILAGRVFAAEPAIGLDEVLAPNAAPPVPLGGVGRDRVAGVVFGMSRAEFAAACTKSGFAVDAIDRAAEPAASLAWFEEGRMAQCEGLPGDRAAFTLGEVTRVVAVFVEGRLAVATLLVRRPLAEVEAKVLAAYPEFVFTPARLIYRIDDEARGDQLLRVGLDGPREDGGCALHFSSERGAHAPVNSSPR